MLYNILYKNITNVFAYRSGGQANLEIGDLPSGPVLVWVAL